MKTVECEITGVAAMLQHRFAAEEHGVNKSRGKKKTYVPEEEAEKALYRSPDGTIYQPSEHILSSLIKAAVNFTYEGKKSFKDCVKAGVIVEPDAISLLDAKGETRTTWDEIDARGVLVQRARVIRWRPKFNQWKLRFKLTIINDDQINTATLKDILEMGGRTGLGDYRPRFGRYTITKWQELSNGTKLSS